MEKKIVWHTCGVRAYALSWCLINECDVKYCHWTEKWEYDTETYAHTHTHKDNE